MTEQKEKFTPDEWTIHEYDSSIVIRDGKNMVCRCSKNAKGKKYARFIKTSQEMYALLEQLHGVLAKVPLLQDEIEKVLKKALGEE